MKKYREKDPYKYHATIAVNGRAQFSVSFTDGQGREHEVTVDREVFVSLQQLKREENRQSYKLEYNVSHFIGAEDDDMPSSIAFYPLCETNPETAALAGEKHAIIANLIQSLTVKQRRRFLLRHLDNLNFAEIAKHDHCSTRSAYLSVRKSEKIIADLLKKFLEGV
jgi:DNA-directed RNA polymerase specialized sigma24 family protein